MRRTDVTIDALHTRQADKLPGHFGLRVTALDEAGSMPSSTSCAEHLGRSTHVWSAAVHDPGGRRIALFRCTQMILW